MSSPQRPGAPSRPRIRRAHSDQQEFAQQGVTQWESPDSDPAAAASRSATHDRSTYYEYIAQHTGGTPSVPGQPSVPGHTTGTPGAPGAPAVHGAPAAHGGPGVPNGAGSPAVPDGAGSPSLPGGPSSGGMPTPPHGYAPAPFRWRGLVAGLVAIAVIVGVLIVLGVVLLGPDRGIQSTDDQTPGPSPSASQAVPDSSVEETAGEQLAAQTDEGTAIAQEQLAEQWVVQLSAKKPGLEANGRTWAEEDILEEFTENQRRHPAAILLWSGDWSSFRLDDFWVTVLAEPYDNPEAALETCRHLGLDRDNCFAKKLSTSEGPDGTTKLND